MNKFWDWYKKNLFLNQVIVALLFGWQLLHLYWLTTHVVADKVLGYPLFNPQDFYEFLLIIADYFEIPALISGTLLYIHSLKEGTVKKNLTFILLINSQWLHLFWITDEFVLEKFNNMGNNILPIWLAWIAIFIDYLELPVIYDTMKDVFKRLISGESNKLGPEMSEAKPELE
jgi:hypothetical protein